MAGKTKIEWATRTWNPLHGCSLVSKGCQNCYAMKLADRFKTHPNEKVRARYDGLTKVVNGNAVWTGEVNLHWDLLDEPFKWKKPAYVFVNSMSDLFHEKVPHLFVDRALETIKQNPHLIFQVLTKRPERMAHYFQIREVPANFWAGTSVEDQKTADERIPELLKIPAKVRFLSCEPLLGPVEFGKDAFSPGLNDYIVDQRVTNDGLCDVTGTVVEYRSALDAGGIHWVIVGGESGPNARPMHPDWARSLRDQCVAADVPFFFKQFGEFQDGSCMGFKNFTVLNTGEFCEPSFDNHSALDRKHGGKWADLDAVAMARVGKKRAGRLLDGREWNETPEVKG